MKILEYYENSKFNFSVNEHEFITIMGTGNKHIMDNLLFDKQNTFIKVLGKDITKKDEKVYRANVGIISNERLNVFTSETVEDELAYGLENLGVKGSIMHENILEMSAIFDFESILNRDPLMIGESKKVLVKIVSCLLLKPKVIILDNVLSILDKKDKKVLIKYLIDYVKSGNCVLNFTSDIEDTLYGNYIILTSKEGMIGSGRTISILKEEKLMNRLGLSLPFIFNLNKQLMYYDIVKEYIMDEERLVDEIWK